MGAGEAGPQGRLEGTVEPFDQAIGLRMVGGGAVQGHTKGTPELGPQ